MQADTTKVVEACLLEVGYSPQSVRRDGETVYFTNDGSERSERFFWRAMEIGRQFEDGHKECWACHWTNPGNPDDLVRRSCQAYTWLMEDCGLDRKALSKQAYEEWKAEQ